jgi:hypothetical protein
MLDASGFTFTVLDVFVPVVVDLCQNVLQVPISSDHFLMEAMALVRGPSSNHFTHHHIDFEPISLLVAKSEERSMGSYEFKVTLILLLAPITVVRVSSSALLLSAFFLL